MKTTCTEILTDMYGNRTYRFERPDGTHGKVVNPKRHYQLGDERKGDEDDEQGNGVSSGSSASSSEVGGVDGSGASDDRSGSQEGLSVSEASEPELAESVGSVEAAPETPQIHTLTGDAFTDNAQALNAIFRDANIDAEEQPELAVALQEEHGSEGRQALPSGSEAGAAEVRSGDASPVEAGADGQAEVHADADPEAS